MNLNPQEAKRLADLLLDTNPGLADDAPSAEEPHPGRLAPGPFGRYRITRLVGLGGMGEVYEAQQESPARTVAIKVVRPDLISGEALRRFDHETRILGRLQHPGIAPIFEAGQVETPAGRTPFFAMEFVDGKPLTSFAAESKLPLRRRLALFLEVCDAVEHAHRKGVIHRDLKPGNLLVGADGRPRVMDFGVARATDSDVRATSLHTEVGRLIGTLPYMSPEQVGGDPDALDTRSDVYSLGVVLYELLCGRLPYELKGEGRGRIPEAVRAIQESEPAPLSSVDRIFRGDLDTIVAKALAKERGQRYQSVGELAADIRRYLADEPIVARRPSAWYQVRKLGQRNKAVAITAAFAVAAMLLGTAISLILAYKEASARHEAQEALRLAHDREADAKEHATTAKAVLEFFEDMVTAAAPGGQGRDVRVSEVMDVAARSLDQGPVENPTAAAALHEAIATTYVALGKYPEGIAQYRKALELRREHSGSDDPDAIIDLMSVAVATAESGAGDPLPLLEEALERSTRVHGETGDETLRCRTALGSCLVRVGRGREAKAMLEAVLVLQRDRFGAAHEDTLGTMGALATALRDLRELPRAETLFREQLAGRIAQLGDRHPAVLSVRNLLTIVLDAEGKYEEAEEFARGTVASAKEVLGEEHPRTLTYCTGLAAVLRMQKKLDEAERVQRPLIEAMGRSQGPAHPDTLLAMTQLGAILKDRGNVAEAADLFRRALEGQSLVLGEAHPQTLLTMERLAAVLAAQGHFDQAEPMARQLLERTEQVWGTDHPDTLLSMNTLAKILKDQKKFEEAAELWSKVVAAADDLLPPGHSYVIVFKTNYGRCLADLDRFEQAEDQLLSALELARGAGPESPRSLAPLGGLVALYDRWKKPEQAARYRSMMAELPSAAGTGKADSPG